MSLSTRLIKAIKWFVAWIVLIIYYLKTGNFAEYDVWNVVGISLPFYIAMYRVCFNNFDELINIRYLSYGGIFDFICDIYNLLVGRGIAESLRFEFLYLGAFLLCVGQTYLLHQGLIKIMPNIG